MNIIKCKTGHFYDADQYMLCPHCGAEPTISDTKETGKSLFQKMKHGVIPKEKKQVSSSKESNEHDDNKTFALSFSSEKAVAEDRISMPASEKKDISVSTSNNDEPCNSDTDSTEENGLSLKDAVNKVTATGDEKTVGFFSSNQAEVSKLVVGWIVGIKGEHFGESFCIYDGRNSVGRNENNDIVLMKDIAVSREKQIWIIYEPKKREFFVQAGESSRLSYINDEGIMQIQRLKRNDVLEIGDGKYVFIPLCDDNFTWEKYINKTE